MKVQLDQSNHSKVLFGPKKIRQKESKNEKNEKEKKLRETHFLSPVWIREKIQGKKIISIKFFFLSFEENRKINRLKILKQ